MPEPDPVYSAAPQPNLLMKVTVTGGREIECAISGDIFGLAAGRPDLTVGNPYGRTLNHGPACASQGSDREASSNIQSKDAWQASEGLRVSICQSTKLGTASASG